MFFSRRSNLDRYLHKSPSGDLPWALVTGASDGIGQEFAGVLAHHGFNVVVHGRNAGKVAAVVDRLRHAHPGRAFKPLIADAVECVREPICLDAIAHALAGLHLTVLVNNVGGANPSLRPLQDIDADELADTVALNATFPTLLLARLLPTLMRHAPALVLNVGSMSTADGAGLPLTGSYSAAKAHVECLSAQLRREMRLAGADVEVLCVRLGRTTGTALNKMPPSLFMPEAKAMAEAAIASVGCRRAETVPYWAHALQQFAMDVTPTWLLDRTLVWGVKQERDRQLRAKVEP
ncbi:short chain dehydrogenase [Xylariomycetidae sp. FL2044]|nr:short chain dehydrogenase [Xylariomycetidae sp. FL2044]